MNEGQILKVLGRIYVNILQHFNDRTYRKRNALFCAKCQQKLETARQTY